MQKFKFNLSTLKCATTNFSLHNNGLFVDDNSICIPMDHPLSGSIDAFKKGSHNLEWWLK